MERIPLILIDATLRSIIYWVLGVFLGGFSYGNEGPGFFSLAALAAKKVALGVWAILLGILLCTRDWLDDDITDSVSDVSILSSVLIKFILELSTETVTGGGRFSSAIGNSLG
jgi:hypothetical protein